MSSGGFNGFYTNHSFRATTASRLFHDNIPEQPIRAQTATVSNAIFNYKRPSDQQIRDVSSVLQGTKCARTENVSSAETKIVSFTTATDDTLLLPSPMSPGSSLPLNSLFQFLGTSNVTVNIVKTNT